MNTITLEKRKIVTACHNHIGGLLGEALLRYFLTENFIKKSDDDYIITEKGLDELEMIGVDVAKLHSTKRKIVDICIESKYGILYEHIGAHLGDLLMEMMIGFGWLTSKGEKEFELTGRGLTGLESMGVKVKSLIN